MSGGSNNRDSTSAAAFTAGATILVLGAAAYSFRQRSLRTARSAVARDLEGTTVCVTGGNNGIGRAVAVALGRRGAKVLIGCRNLEQAKKVCDSLGNDRCRAFQLDLASSASVEAFSESIRNETTRTGLQLLINNAGAMIKEHDKDAGDGWDRSMAVNHLGWVQLTRNLLPVLEKTAAASNASSTATATSSIVRVVNVGSKLEKQASLPTNVSDPQQWDEWVKSSVTPYGPFPAYANAKLAMTAVTFHWANLLKTTGRSTQNPPVQMMVVSPGMVNTSLPRFMPLWQRVLTLPFRALLLKTPEQGAETVLFAATSPAACSGTYYSECQKIQGTDKCSEAAQSPEIGQHIWEATLRALNTRK